MGCLEDDPASYEGSATLDRGTNDHSELPKGVGFWWLVLGLGSKGL